jgi:protein-S-isoprenylcysteine O-methyltransferase Ste14
VPSWATIARRTRVPVGFVFAAVYFWLARPTLQSIFIGTIIVICGLLIRALASGYVRKNEELTTSGPYAYTRNPLYLGSLILAAGFGWAAQNWWIVAAILLIFTVIYIPVILEEEKFLHQRFPEFQDYSRQVPRFIPRLRPIPGTAGAFSWDLYRKHREYHAVIGSIAMLAALAIKMLWMSR